MTPELSEETVEAMARAFGRAYFRQWEGYREADVAQVVTAMRSAIAASGLVEALNALAVECASDPKRAPWPVWAGPGQSQRVSTALNTVRALISPPTKEGER